MRRLKAALLVFFMILSFHALAMDAMSEGKIVFEDSKITIGVGEKTALEFEAVPPISADDLDFVSAKPDVVTVSDDGIVTGLKKGTSKVTVTTPDGAYDTIKVKVAAAPSKVKITPDKKIFGVGEIISCEVKYRSGEAGKYTLKTSDGSVVCIENGQLKAAAPGKAKITARAYNGKKASVTVTVKKAPDFIAFASDSVTLASGQSCIPELEKTPESAARITFETSDASVAKVSSEGEISAVAPGNAVITARTHNGLSADVAVLVKPAPEKIIIPEAEVSIGIGEKFTITPELQPENAMTDYTFTSKKPAIASVGKKGTVTGKAAGSCKIIIRSHNGKKATLKVNVVSAPTSVKPTLPRNELGVGETVQAGCKFNKGASGTVTYYCKPTGIISVDKNGIVTALKQGTAKLIARSQNGIKGSISVKVVAAPDSIAPVAGSYTTGVGAEIVPEIKLPNGTAGSICYESLDHEIAVPVNGGSAIKGVKPGQAVIRAVAYNGVSCDITLNVILAPEKIILAHTDITLFEGQSEELSVEVVPEGAFCEYTVETSDPDVVSVSGTEISAKGSGTAVITVKTYNGKKSSCTVTVPKAPQKITLKKDYASIKKGETFVLKYSLPKGTQTVVTFSTTDASVASVDSQSGLVTGTGSGTALITARTLNGKKAVCMVNVESDAPRSPDGDFRITFMNIGRNDGIYISCGGENAFIDSGLKTYGLQAVDYLKKQGVDHLKYYIGTHAHRDHVEGAAAIMAAIDTDVVIMPHDGVRSLIIKSAETAAEKNAVEKVNYQKITVGDSFWLGGAKFECIGPVSILDTSPADVAENGNSLVLRVTYGSNTFLLTGDATGTEINEIHAKNPGCFRAQVLKNPHHNGEARFLVKICKPEITVFSTSSRYIPLSSYQKYILKWSKKIYITADNRHGHVTMISNGSDISVTTQH